MAETFTPPSFPRISIVVPVYNAAPFLAITLDSALAQTRSDWEMIVVDDGSTDGSGAIAAEYCGREARIRLVQQTN